MPRNDGNVSGGKRTRKRRKRVGQKKRALKARRGENNDKS